jgi:hypothetical protein
MELDYSRPIVSQVIDLHAAALSDTLVERRIERVSISTTRRMWDVFHMATDAGHIHVNSLYRKYHDDHIETALRKYFSE